MPNIRQQIVGPLGSKAISQLPGDDIGLYIQTSDGTEVSVTKRAIQAHYQSLNGSAASKRAETISWIKEQLAAVGNQIDTNNVKADFDDSDGTPTTVEVS